MENGSNDDLRWVASTTQGRSFLWSMLSFCGVYKDPEGDINEIQKQLGKRQVGLHLLGLLGDEDDELIFSMMREAKNKHIAQEIKDDNASRNTDDPTDDDNALSDIARYFIGDTNYHESGADDTLDSYASGGAIF